VTDQLQRVTSLKTCVPSVTTVKNLRIQIVFFSLSLSPTSPGKLFWIFSWAALGRSVAVSSIECGIWLTLILSFSWNPSNECLNNALKRITNISLYTIRNNRFQGHATLAVDVAFFFSWRSLLFRIPLCLLCGFYWNAGSPSQVLFIRKTN
jgi:hypothetical protein